MIHAALPGARIIHMRRNPIDTCLSIYFHNFHIAHSYSNDLDDLAHYYDEYLGVMRHWHAILPPGAILDVPYEALVQDSETWSRKMVDFVGLPWDEACLSFHQTRRSVSTFSKWQVRQKISTASVERWRNYAAFVGPLLRLLASEVAA
jgi:Sulfotransferase family